MKIYSKLLALSVFHHGVTGAASFLAQAPKTQSSIALNAYSRDRMVDEAKGTRYADRRRQPWYDLPDSPQKGRSMTRYDRPREEKPWYEDFASGPLRPDQGDRTTSTREYSRPQRASEYARPQQEQFGSPERRTSRQEQPRAWYEGPIPRSSVVQGGSRSRSIPRSSTVQGGSRQTWTADPYAAETEVNLSSQGRPIDTDLQFYEGPNNTPTRLRVYSEDGHYRPFNARFKSPRTRTGAVDVRNAGPMEYPVSANVQGVYRPRRANTWDMHETTIQGGALRTFDFGPYTEAVQVDLYTDGLPLMAKIELWQGPSNIKQLAEVYADDGMSRSFSAVLETPGYESTIAIRNTGTMEFPLKASLEPL